MVISQECEPSEDIFPIIIEFLSHGESIVFERMVHRYFEDHPIIMKKFEYIENINLYNFLKDSFEYDTKNVKRFGTTCIIFIRAFFPSINPNNVFIKDMWRCFRLIDKCSDYAYEKDYKNCIDILRNILDILGNTIGASRVKDVLYEFEKESIDLPFLIEDLAVTMGVDFQV